MGMSSISWNKITYEQFEGGNYRIEASDILQSKSFWIHIFLHQQKIPYLQKVATYLRMCVINNPNSRPSIKKIIYQINPNNSGILQNKLDEYRWVETKFG